MAQDPRAVRGAYTPAARAPDVTPDTLEPIAGATAAEQARRAYGGPTRVQSTTFTLTTTVQQVLGNNPRRVFWSVINRGVVNAAVDWDPGMTYANGILLGAAGGFAQADVREDGETTGWALFGASESGSAVLRVVEIMRV